MLPLNCSKALHTTKIINEGIWPTDFHLEASWNRKTNFHCTQTHRKTVNDISYISLPSIYISILEIRYEISRPLTKLIFSY